MRIFGFFWQNLIAAARILNLRQFGEYICSLLLNIPQIISCRSLRPADASFMKGRSVLDVLTMGGVIRLKQPDFGLVRELYGRCMYFPEHVFVPPPGSKVMDLGANVGLFSMLCAKLGAEILAVEAQSGFIEIARNNFALNGMENRIELVHAIVGGSTGVFSKNEFRKASSHWVDDPTEVSMEKLVNMFLKNKGEMIHLLKIDIEGSEFDLFKKDIGWLDKILHISMEVHPEFGDVSSLLKQIEATGFRCNLVTSWHEVGIPERYPGFLFASRIG